MPGRLVFLVEELSMKALLDGLLPRLMPGWVVERDFKCVPHEGKSDLDTSAPRKLRAWQVPGDRFVIVRDNDNANCVQLKARYTAMCEECGRPDTLVRLVCQELESWYLGDLLALAKAFDDANLNSPKLNKRFAKPDDWQKPSDEIKRLVPRFQKTGGARLLAQHLAPQRNQSPSFHAFVDGVRRVALLMSSD